MGTFATQMDFMIKPIRTLLGMEEGEPPAVAAMPAHEVEVAREETGSMLSSTFRCPERG